MNSTNWGVTGASSICTARIAAIRPRGDFASSPVTRKVGQCGRQSPQLTHEASSSSSILRSIDSSPYRPNGLRCRYRAVLMPEGHTIHRLARDQNRLLKGKVVRVSSPQGRFAADAALVDGQKLLDVSAFGKHLFYEWGDGSIGHVHLGLFGKFKTYRTAEPPPPRGEVRMRLVTDGATIDLSGPTACMIGDEDDRQRIVRRLGPDPLRRDSDPGLAFDRISRSRQPIGALLLDQSVIAGVGNVYRAEALFVTGIHPSRPGMGCEQVELDALWMTVTAMLRQGVKDNRIITVDRRALDLPVTGRIRRGEATYVYHRDSCLRCGSAIQTVTLGGRSCYFCPTCQPG